MAASTYSVAKNLFHWANGNPARIAELQNEFDSAVSAGMLTKGGLDGITSATKNGITMQKSIGATENDRISAIQMALKWLDAGFIGGSRTRAVF